MEREWISSNGRAVWLEADDGSGIRNLFASPDGDGRRGQVMAGINGEWYVIPLSREAWAYPLQGLDNIHGTGHATPQAAVTAWLREGRS